MREGDTAEAMSDTVVSQELLSLVGRECEPSVCRQLLRYPECREELSQPFSQLYRGAAAAAAAAAAAPSMIVYTSQGNQMSNVILFKDNWICNINMSVIIWRELSTPRVARSLQSADLYSQ